MNYFEFYNLTPAFQINVSDLRKRYYEQSRASHPDMQLKLQQQDQDGDYFSALNNQAYKTLLHPLSRLKYLLDTEFSSDESDIVRDEPGFLAEMMELHEFIQESLISEDVVLLSEGAAKLKQFEDQAQLEVESHLFQFDRGARTPEIKQAMGSYYNKLKYFTRLRETMEGKESEL